MLVGYSRPDVDSWTISGTGASIDTDDAALTNGRPGGVTRFTWLSGSQTTSSVVTLDASWPTAQATKPRIIAVLGITLPVGTLVKVQFPDGSGGWQDPAGGNFSQRVQALPDGSRAVWMVVDAPASNIETLRLEFYNDVDGAATIAADSEFDIGEIWFSPAVTLNLKAGEWDLYPVDPTVVNVSLSRQPWFVPRQQYRVLEGPLVAEDTAMIRKGGLENGMDLELLLAALSGGNVGAFIPRRTDDTGAFDEDELHRTAIFGYVDPGATSIPNVRGPNFEGEWRSTEIPANAVS